MDLMSETRSNAQQEHGTITLDSADSTLSNVHVHHIFQKSDHCIVPSLQATSLMGVTRQCGWASHQESVFPTTLAQSQSRQIIENGKRGFRGNEADGIQLDGPNIIEGFRRLGYRTIGSGAVGWFDPKTETGAVLSQPFDSFFYPGNTWSLREQLKWIDDELNNLPKSTPTFLFLNVGETHVPYWHIDADWPREPSPCTPLTDLITHGGNVDSNSETAWSGLIKN